jgi:hypothetical protein
VHDKPPLTVALFVATYFIYIYDLTTLKAAEADHSGGAV